MASEIRPSSVAGGLLPEAPGQMEEAIVDEELQLWIGFLCQDVADKVVFSPPPSPLAARHYQDGFPLPLPWSALPRRGSTIAAQSLASEGLSHSRQSSSQKLRSRTTPHKRPGEQQLANIHKSSGKDKAKAPEPVLQGLDPNVVVSARTAGVRIRKSSFGNVCGGSARLFWCVRWPTGLWPDASFVRVP